MNFQLKLFQPDRTITTLTVAEVDLEATLAHVRTPSGILLSFSVKGATYTLSLDMPPVKDLPQGMEAAPLSGNHAGMNQRHSRNESINDKAPTCRSYEP